MKHENVEWAPFDEQVSAKAPDSETHAARWPTFRNSWKTSYLQNGWTDHSTQNYFILSAPTLPLGVEFGSAALVVLVSRRTDGQTVRHVRYLIY